MIHTYELLKRPIFVALFVLSLLAEIVYLCFSFYDERDMIAFADAEPALSFEVSAKSLYAASPSQMVNDEETNPDRYLIITPVAKNFIPDWNNLTYMIYPLTTFDGTDLVQYKGNIFGVVKNDDGSIKLWLNPVLDEAMYHDAIENMEGDEQVIRVVANYNDPNYSFNGYLYNIDTPILAKKAEPEKPAELEIPTFKSGLPDEDGESISADGRKITLIYSPASDYDMTVLFENYDSETMSITTDGGKIKNAGTYKITVSVKEGLNAVFKGVNSTTIDYEFTIIKRAVNENLSLDKTAVLIGGKAEYTVESDLYFVLSYKKFGLPFDFPTEAGQYEVTLQLRDGQNYRWSHPQTEESADRVAELIVSNTAVDKPKVKDTFEYMYLDKNVFVTSATGLMISDIFDLAQSGGVVNFNKREENLKNPIKITKDGTEISLNETIGAGTYTIEFVLPENFGVEWSGGDSYSLTFKVTLGVPVLGIPQINELVYRGSEYALTDSFSWENNDAYFKSIITPSLEGAENLLDAGEYMVKLTINSGDAGVLGFWSKDILGKTKDSCTLSVGIAKAKIDIVVSASGEYTGTVQSISDVKVTATWDDSQRIADISDAIISYKAGSAVINVVDGGYSFSSVNGDDLITVSFSHQNYELDEVSGKYIINPKDIRLSISAESVEYDGTDKLPDPSSLSLKFYNAIPSDNLDYTAIEIVGEAVNAGVYNFTGKGETALGKILVSLAESQQNYKLISVDGTFEVLKAGISIKLYGKSNYAAADIVFGSENLSIEITENKSGKFNLAFEDLKFATPSVHDSGAYNFVLNDGSRVENSIQVSLSDTLNAKNFFLKTVSGAFTVTAAEISVEFTTVNATYSGADYYDRAVEVKFGPTVNGEDWRNDIDYSITVFNGGSLVTEVCDAGEYAVRVTILNKNYTLSGNRDFSESTFIVEKASVRLEISGGDKYTGTTQEVSADKVAITVKSETTSLDLSDYLITFTVGKNVVNVVKEGYLFTTDETDDGICVQFFHKNYRLAAENPISGKYIIYPAEICLKTESKAVYNATAQLPRFKDIAVEGLVNGETFGEKDILIKGDAINAKVYSVGALNSGKDITLSLAENVSNYILLDAEGTFTISPATVTVYGNYRNTLEYAPFVSGEGEISVLNNFGGLYSDIPDLDNKVSVNINYLLANPDVGVFSYAKSEITISLRLIGSFEALKNYETEILRSFTFELTITQAEIREVSFFYGQNPEYDKSAKELPSDFEHTYDGNIYYVFAFGSTANESNIPMAVRDNTFCDVPLSDYKFTAYVSAGGRYSYGGNASAVVKVAARDIKVTGSASVYVDFDGISNSYTATVTSQLSTLHLYGVAPKDKPVVTFTLTVGNGKVVPSGVYSGESIAISAFLSGDGSHNYTSEADFGEVEFTFNVVKPRISAVVWNYVLDGKTKTQITTNGISREYDATEYTVEGVLTVGFVSGEMRTVIIPAVIDKGNERVDHIRDVGIYTCSLESEVYDFGLIARSIEVSVTPFIITVAPHDAEGYDFIYGDEAVWTSEPISIILNPLNEGKEAEKIFYTYTLDAALVADENNFTDGFLNSGTYLFTSKSQVKVKFSGTGSYNYDYKLDENGVYSLKVAPVVLSVSQKVQSAYYRGYKPLADGNFTTDSLGISVEISAANQLVSGKTVGIDLPDYLINFVSGDTFVFDGERVARKVGNYKVMLTLADAINFVFMDGSERTSAMCFDFNVRPITIFAQLNKSSDFYNGQNYYPELQAEFFTGDSKNITDYFYSANGKAVLVDENGVFNQTSADAQPAFEIKFSNGDSLVDCGKYNGSIILNGFISGNFVSGVIAVDYTINKAEIVIEGNLEFNQTTETRLGLDGLTQYLQYNGRSKRLIVSNDFAGVEATEEGYFIPLAKIWNELPEKLYCGAKLRIEFSTGADAKNYYIGYGSSSLSAAIDSNQARNYSIIISKSFATEVEVSPYISSVSWFIGGNRITGSSVQTYYSGKDLLAGSIITYSASDVSGKNLNSLNVSINCGGAQSSTLINVGNYEINLVSADSNYTLTNNLLGVFVKPHVVESDALIAVLENWQNESSNFTPLQSGSYEVDGIADKVDATNAFARYRVDDKGNALKAKVVLSEISIPVFTATGAKMFLINSYFGEQTSAQRGEHKVGVTLRLASPNFAWEDNYYDGLFESSYKQTISYDSVTGELKVEKVWYLVEFFNGLKEELGLPNTDVNGDGKMQDYEYGWVFGSFPGFLSLPKAEREGAKMVLSFGKVPEAAAIVTGTENWITDFEIARNFSGSFENPQNIACGVSDVLNFLSMWFNSATPSGNYRLMIIILPEYDMHSGAELCSEYRQMYDFTVLPAPIVAEHALMDMEFTYNGMPQYYDASRLPKLCIVEDIDGLRAGTGWASSVITRPESLSTIDVDLEYYGKTETGYPKPQILYGGDIIRNGYYRADDVKNWYNADNPYLPLNVKVRGDNTDMPYKLFYKYELKNHAAFLTVNGKVLTDQESFYNVIIHKVVLNTSLEEHGGTEIDDEGKMIKWTYGGKVNSVNVRLSGNKICYNSLSGNADSIVLGYSFRSEIFTTEVEQAGSEYFARVQMPETVLNAGEYSLNVFLVNGANSNVNYTLGDDKISFTIRVDRMAIAGNGSSGGLKIPVNQDSSTGDDAERRIYNGEGIPFLCSDDFGIFYRWDGEFTEASPINADLYNVYVYLTNSNYKWDDELENIEVITVGGKQYECAIRTMRILPCEIFVVLNTQNAKHLNSVYDGNEHFVEFKFARYCNGNYVTLDTELTNGYTVSYSLKGIETNPLNVGSYSVQIKLVKNPASGIFAAQNFQIAGILDSDGYGRLHDGYEIGGDGISVHGQFAVSAAKVVLNRTDFTSVYNGEYQIPERLEVLWKGTKLQWGADYVLSSVQAKNAGTYMFEVTLTNSNFTFGSSDSSTVFLTINKALATAHADGTYIFNGLDRYDEIVKNIVVQSELGRLYGFTVDRKSIVNAGDYLLKVTLSDEEKMNFTFDKTGKDLNYIQVQTSIGSLGIFATASGAKEFNGKSLHAEINFGGDWDENATGTSLNSYMEGLYTVAYIIEKDGAEKVVGDGVVNVNDCPYKVVVRLKDWVNNFTLVSCSGTFEVLPARVTVSVRSEYVYNAENRYETLAHSIGFKNLNSDSNRVPNADEYKFTLSNEYGITNEFTNAGSYNLTISISENMASNFRIVGNDGNTSDSATIGVYIAKAQVALRADGCKTFRYNGSDRLDFLISMVKFTNPYFADAVPSGFGYMLMREGEQTSEFVSVGEYSLIVTLSEEESANFEIVGSNTITGIEIQSKIISEIKWTVPDYTYTGEQLLYPRAQAIIALSNEMVDLPVLPTTEFFSDAGTYVFKAQIPFTDMVVGRGVSMNKSVTVKPAEVRLEQTYFSGSYNGRAHTLPRISVLWKDNVLSDQLYKVTPDDIVMVGVGIYEFHVLLNSGNFIFPDGKMSSFTYAVEKVAVAIGAQSRTTVYNGKEQGIAKPVLPDWVDENRVMVTYNGNTAKPVNAGVYAVAITVPDTPDYFGATVYADLVIERQVVEIRWNTQTQFEYDGSAKTILTGITGADSDLVTITYEGTNSVIFYGAPSEAGEYLVTVNLVDSNNYVIKGAQIGLFTITESESEAEGENAPPALPVTYMFGAIMGLTAVMCVLFVVAGIKLFKKQGAVQQSPAKVWVIK